MEDPQMLPRGISTRGPAERKAKSDTDGSRRLRSSAAAPPSGCRAILRRDGQGERAEQGCVPRAGLQSPRGSAPWRGVRSSQSPLRRFATAALPPSRPSPCCVLRFADAMAEPQMLKELQEELTCSICLDIYRSPVSLRCGHSFCEECIQAVLGSQRCPQELFSCPVCSAQEAPPAKLQPNIQLRSIVQKFLDTSEQNSAPEEELKREVECEEIGGSSGPCGMEILCDFCLEKPQPAVKTCMNCETSLCQAHLGKHSTKAFLTSHVLVEPCDARVLAARRCPQHGKLLECYCVTDSVCVCMMCCATSSHRTHEIISVEEAFGQAQNDFPKTLETVKTHKDAVSRSLKNLLKCQENIKALERLRRNHLENFFKTICEELDRRKTEILKTISDIQEQQLSQIQPQIKEHEEMKDAASHDVQELEALRDQKDPVLFLKGLAAIQARRREQVPNQDGIELAELLSIMDGSIKETFREHFQPFVRIILYRKPTVSLLTREHLTFESCQASGLHVDDKQLSVVEPPCSSFEPHKVQFWVFSTKCFWNGLHFWEVVTRNSFYWKVGVVDYTFECYLEVSRCHLKVFLNEKKIHNQFLKTAIRLLRVQLDCERNAVSFFDVSGRDWGSPRSCMPIATVTIPASYPVYAVFSIADGSISLL
ncbi:E3 ubiquitin/ISG15 ligase TRIM25-like [Cyrtonyx montezumae]|uniref:E3 ubiquitin/ISG15 ligase TRIM25-like n=1 Tax=Cyrtonyx montezumae TaxID=9017 RepID=UPI0032DBBDB5